MSERVTHHIIQELIEHVYSEHGVPRIFVNATLDGVILPGHVRDLWGYQLPIDLKSSDPLDLEYDAIGLHVTLSFHPTVSRCTFPWAAIWAIGDKTRGNRLMLLAAHVPTQAADLGFPTPIPPPKTETSDLLAPVAKVSLRRLERPATTPRSTRSLRALPGGARPPALRLIPGGKK